MKKNILISTLFMIIIVIAFSSCTNKENESNDSNIYEYIPYGQLPEDYNVEDAKSDGCVVFEDLQLTSGDEAWKQFLETAQAGKAASVRLANYYTLDAQNISEEYYAEVKDEYPVLYVQDLSFDGENYRLYYTEGEKEYEYKYPYLVKFTGPPNSSTATYSQYERYFLVRDKSVTFEQIQIGWLSSYTGNQVDCVAVYTDLKK